MRKKIKLWLLLTNITLLFGCAVKENPDDPYEVYNRAMFKFNVAADRAVIRPAARAYNKIVPAKAQARVTNFYNNLSAIPTVANDILQLDVYDTFADASRFAINTTIGLLGFFDVASHMNLPYHYNDAGLTLARWGMDKSPYFVIPIFGPSTIRDGAGLAATTYLSIWPYVDPAYIGWGAGAFNVVQLRAQILPADKVVEEAYDPYLFVRNAYLQHRQIALNRVLGKHDQAQKTTDTFVSADTNETENTPEAKNSTTNKTNSSDDTFVAP
jgi:phospholipid-binding lipoprotein MlaA